MRIGELQIDPVIDGCGTFPPTVTFRGTTPEQWERHRDLLDGDGRLEFTLGGFLVRGGGHVTLVDLGLGHRQFYGLRGGRFLDELGSLGIEASDVTDVVFTHLHYDHVGWAATAAGAATFPAATYRCAAADLTYFTVDNPEHLGGLLDPVLDRFETWESDGELLSGVSALGAPGHTPGSAVIVLSSGTDRALLLGDVAHCPVELLDAEIAGLGEVDAALAAKTREVIARELEGSQTPAVAAHFPRLQFGRLIRAEGKRQWMV
jgi:glyoxylase-like metal-dependent hydrolase (beta-lactamase superfamily II)